MTCDEKITVILNFFSQKVFISLVTPLRYYTRMSAFFSNPRNTSETLFWYLINSSKRLSFHRRLQCWEEEKVSGGQIR